MSPNFRSIFCETDIDMIKDFALDFMYVVCLGVTRIDKELLRDIFTPFSS